jgi:phenylalanyl-tRNA synthetase beta chain
MLLSLKWLKKFVPDLEIADLESFKHTVDTHLSEVERVEERGNELQGLVVARVESVEEHPTHKNLKVCRVDVGENELRQIVCGADNVRAGMWSVAVLPGGTVLADGKAMNIAVRAVAGVESHGMLCAPDELGLNDDHRGIIEIDHSVPVGTDVTEYFRDVVIEIENKAVPHRSDAFSHLGIARELAAMFELELQMPTPEIPPVGYIDSELEIHIENRNPESAPRYMSMLFSNAQVGPSPLWMQIFLAYAGERPINNIVDLTNFVMHHVGQPLHAFDADKLEQHKVIIRKAQAGEQIVALDNNMYKLTPEMLVIADGEKPIALAGIMGGVGTAITTETKNILVEAANFEMYAVRRTSRQLGLRTQASTRYEKGQNAEQTALGLKLAAEMLVHQGLAEIASSLQDHYPNPETKKVIQFDLHKVRKLIGADIPKQRIVDSLENLGFSLIGAEKYSSADLARSDVGLTIDVEVPFWRRDVNQEADLLEEVARSFGYDNITATLPRRDLARPAANKHWERIVKIKTTLAASGLYEVITYSMVGKELYKQSLRDPGSLMAISNPISPELSLVRDSIVPSIVDKIEINQQRYTEFGLFEVSRVALKALDEGGELPQQPFYLAAARAGTDLAATYGQLKHSFDILNQQVFHSALTIMSVEGGQISPHLHPGKSGAIVHSETQEILGYIGVLHPTVKENMRISGEAAIWEIDLTQLLEQDSVWEQHEFVNLNHFPVATRDISFWQKERSFLEETLQALRAELRDNLFDLQVIDIFDDKKRRSVTIRLKLQGDHTFTADEINALILRTNSVIEGHEHTLR